MPSLCFVLKELTPWMERSTKSTSLRRTDSILHHLMKELASVFGVDREIVTVNREGSSGSEIAEIAAKHQIKEEEIKTKVPTLRQELENVHRLAAAIASQGAKFEEKNAADVYRVTISGLASTTTQPLRSAR
ncbi:hypothetical protein COOONC_09474 [Cooperia oncophora]